MIEDVWMDRFIWMETFIAVVQEQSYTKAAVRLGVSRAMVSRRMQNLEAHLGVKLLHRDPHGVNVSSIGSDFFESCQDILERLYFSEELVRNEVIMPQGRLKIVSTKTIGENIVSPLIADFCKLYPEIKVELRLVEGRLDLGMRDYDVAIGSLPSADSTLTVRSVINLPRVLVASSEYIKNHSMPQTPKELWNHNCLDPSGNPYNTWRFRGKNGMINIRVSGNPRCNASTLIRHAALQGLGIAIVREYLVAEDLKKGRLIRVLPDFDLDKHALYTIFSKDSRMPARVRVLIKFLAERLRLLPGIT